MLYGRRCRIPLFWMRWDNGNFLDPTNCKKSWDKFVWRERTGALCYWGRRVTPIIEQENWVLKLETKYTSRCYLWEIYDVLRNEASSHLGSLVHSRSRRRDKMNERQNFWIPFLIHLNLEGEIHFKGVGLSHPKISKFWNVTKIHKILKLL
jgi:hypothetical protein